MVGFLQHFLDAAVLNQTSSNFLAMEEFFKGLENVLPGNSQSIGPSATFCKNSIYDLQSWVSSSDIYTNLSFLPFDCLIVKIPCERLTSSTLVLQASELRRPQQ